MQQLNVRPQTQSKQLIRGAIYMVNLPVTRNSIQGGMRPVVICANSMACKFSPVIHAVPLTSKVKRWMPTHVEIPTTTGLIRTSTALCEQVMLIPKESFTNMVGYCNDSIMSKISSCLMVQFGLDGASNKTRVIS